MSDQPPAPHRVPAISQSVEAEKPKPGQKWLHRFASALGFSNGDSLKDKLERALKEDEDSEDALSPQERTMLLNILEFGESRVSDVMVPRADIVAIDESATLGELLQLFAKANHSRIPVYNGTLDAATGMVHIKDVLRWMTAQSLPLIDESASLPVPSGAASDTPSAIDLKCIDLSRDIASLNLRKTVLFAPSSSSALSLLHTMQSRRMHLALVYDEFGGIEGLVTIEDLVEEVVGDIEDEHATEPEPLIVEDAKGLIVNARAPVEDLSAYLGVDLTLPNDEDEPESIGGVILSIVGHLPSAGERILHPAGYEFEVLSVGNNRIGKMRIRQMPDTSVHSKKSERPAKSQASNTRPEAA